MVEQKKDNPQKGEFIDLDKSDFKKKTGFFKIFLKYLVIFIIFFSSGLIAYKPLKENLYYKSYETEKLEEKDVKIGQEKLKDEYLLKLEKMTNNFSEKLNFYEEKINNLESKNKDLTIQLDDISQSFKNFQQFNPNDSYLLDYKKNRVLINFLILQENFNNRKDFGNEIETLISLFLGDYEISSLLNFFKALDIEDLDTKENLIQKVNESLLVYENDIDDLFTKIENKSYTKTSNIFSSKEEFVNYAKDVLNSTFKVTKFNQDKKYKANENFEPLKKTLLLVKESLLVDDINQAIIVLEASNIDNVNLKSWLVEAKRLAEANNNFNKFKIKVLNLME
tara:strand:+ start:755 stop:1765 length:1011 start_codon:yes stop_codon:yes gene_type:complete